MKKILAFLLAICTVFSFTACAGMPASDDIGNEDTTGENSDNPTENAEPARYEFEGEDYVIEWADEMAERDTRAALNKSSGDIYASEVYHFEDFDFSSSHTLDDIIHFPNLRSASANGTTGLDFSPLSAAVYLENLYLGDNDIDDLTFLSGLTNLKYLILSDNQITDITPLSGLINLEFIDLDSNQITDIAAFENLTNLQTVHLVENNVTDWLPTAHIEEVFGRGEFAVAGSGIYEEEPFIGTWKAEEREHYITLRADGTATIASPYVDTLSTTFVNNQPFIEVRLDDGTNYVLVHDATLNMLVAVEYNTHFEFVEGEAPDISLENSLNEAKDSLLGVWKSETVDYILTFNSDDTFILENANTGDFDSGTFIIEIDPTAGYQVDFNGDKYSYSQVLYKNATLALLVTDKRTNPSGIDILSNSHIFTVEE